MKVCVLGGGSGGLAMAGDLALAGFNVSLYEAPEFKENITPVFKDGEIEVVGVGRTGIAKLGKVTTNMGEAVEGADIINVVTLAQGHEMFYNRLAPHLKDGQIVITHTGYYGSLQLRQILKTKGINRDVTIGETGPLLYACRRTPQDKVRVTGLKSKVLFATLPAVKTRETLGILNKLFPQFVPALNVLETSVDNLGYVFHTAVTLLNVGRIEDTDGEFLFYIQGITPSVARLVEALDNERIAVEKAFGFKPIPASEVLKNIYGSTGKNLYEVFHNTKPFQDPVVTKAPSDLIAGRDHRYITEEVPYGLVPLAYLGDLAKVPTPTAKALIHIASSVNCIDYMREGVTLKKMGLAGKTIEQISRFIG